MYGEIGTGAQDGAKVLSPTQVGTSQTWSFVSAGGLHSCGLNMGRLFCWGNNSSAQTGLGRIENNAIYVPTQVGSSDLWSTISTGDIHTCGIDNGQLFCWGKSLFGRLGVGDTTDLELPNQVGLSKSWSNISTGSSHTSLAMELVAVHSFQTL